MQRGLLRKAVCLNNLGLTGNLWFLGVVRKESNVLGRACYTFTWSLSSEVMPDSFVFLIPGGCESVLLGLARGFRCPVVLQRLLATVLHRVPDNM